VDTNFKEIWPPDFNPAFLWYTNSNTSYFHAAGIWQYQDTNTWPLPMTSLANRMVNLSHFSIAGIALDLSTQFLYFAETTTKAIYKVPIANLIRNETIYTVVTGRSHAPYDLELDLRAGKRRLYWTEPGLPGVQDGGIYSVNLDGPKVVTNITIAISIGMVDPHGLALDLTKNMMYWVDSNMSALSHHRTGAVYSCQLNGNGASLVLSQNLSQPRGIALDTKDSVMYITDNLQGKIVQASYLRNSTDDVAMTVNYTTLYKYLVLPEFILLSPLRDTLYWTSSAKIYHEPISFLNPTSAVGVQEFHAKFSTRTTVYTCDDATQAIYCPPGSVIVTVSATYGRTTRLVCEELGNNNIITCNRDVLALVKALCDNQYFCELQPNSGLGIFGNPCPGVSKYLTVTFDCTEPAYVVGITFMSPTSYVTAYSGGTLYIAWFSTGLEGNIQFSLYLTKASESSQDFFAVPASDGTYTVNLDPALPSGSYYLRASAASNFQDPYIYAVSPTFTITARTLSQPVSFTGALTFVRSSLFPGGATATTAAACGALCLADSSCMGYVWNAVPVPLIGVHTCTPLASWVSGTAVNNSYFGQVIWPRARALPYFDDFCRVSGDWTAVQGVWRATNCWYEVKGTSYGDLAWIGDAVPFSLQWKDYNISVKLFPDFAQNGAASTSGLILRAQTVSARVGGTFWVWSSANINQGITGVQLGSFASLALAEASCQTLYPTCGGVVYDGVSSYATYSGNALSSSTGTTAYLLSTQTVASYGGQYYHLYLSRAGTIGFMTFGKMFNGAWKLLKSTTFTYATDQWSTLRVEANKNTFWCSVSLADGTYASFHLTDSTYTNGSVGLRSNMAPTSFAQMHVYGLDPSPQNTSTNTESAAGSIWKAQKIQGDWMSPILLVENQGAPAGLAVDVGLGPPLIPYWDCYGHGYCSGFDGQFKCACNKGWEGNCKYATCPKGPAWFDDPWGTDLAHAEAECSNMGLCDHSTGLCECHPLFEGAACQRLKCPKNGQGSECSDAGSCLSMRQLALMHTDSQRVPYPLLYGSPLNSSKAAWDADMVHGCACASYGFLDGNKIPDPVNYMCSELACPTGDNSFTASLFEIQSLQCTIATGVTGTFTLTFRGKTTSAISSLATVAELTSALNSLSTIGDVNVWMNPVTTTICAPTGSNVKVQFKDALGDLPLMTADTTNLNGGTVVIQQQVQGTKQNVECSSNGLCDSAVGECMCFANYISSDGNRKPGKRGDCGAMKQNC